MQPHQLARIALAKALGNWHEAACRKGLAMPPLEAVMNTRAVANLTAWLADQPALEAVKFFVDSRNGRVHMERIARLLVVLAVGAAMDGMPASTDAGVAKLCESIEQIRQNIIQTLARLYKTGIPSPAAKAEAKNLITENVLELATNAFAQLVEHSPPPQQPQQQPQQQPAAPQPLSDIESDALARMSAAASQHVLGILLDQNHLVIDVMHCVHKLNPVQPDEEASDRGAHISGSGSASDDGSGSDSGDSGASDASYQVHFGAVVLAKMSERIDALQAEVVDVQARASAAEQIAEEAHTKAALAAEKLVSPKDLRRTAVRAEAKAATLGDQVEQLSTRVEQLSTSVAAVEAGADLVQQLSTRVATAEARTADAFAEAKAAMRRTQAAEETAAAAKKRAAAAEERAAAAEERVTKAEEAAASALTIVHQSLATLEQRVACTLGATKNMDALLVAKAKADVDAVVRPLATAVDKLQTEVAWMLPQFHTQFVYQWQMMSALNTVQQTVRMPMSVRTMAVPGMLPVGTLPPPPPPPRTPAKH